MSYQSATTYKVSIPKRVTWNSSHPETTRRMSSTTKPANVFQNKYINNIPQNGLLARATNACQAGVKEWKKSGNTPYPLGNKIFSQSLKDGFNGSYYHGTSLSRLNSHDPLQLLEGELRAGGAKFVGPADLAGFYAKTKEDEKAKDGVVLELAHWQNDYPDSDEMHPYFTGPAQILSVWELSKEYRNHTETYPNIAARVKSALAKGIESF